MVGELDLLHAERGVDHVEDRRVAELEDRVFAQAREPLERNPVVGGQLLEGRPDVLPAGDEAFPGRPGVRFRLLELGEVEAPCLQLLVQLVQAPLLLRGRPGSGRKRVLVPVALRVERRLRELELLVRQVDLRGEVLQLPVEPCELAAVRGQLLVRQRELVAKLRAFLAERDPPGGERGLAGLAGVDPRERALDALPAAGVVLHDHTDENYSQDDPGRREDAVQLRDVVVVIDRLGGGSAGHGYAVRLIC